MAVSWSAVPLLPVVLELEEGAPFSLALAVAWLDAVAVAVIETAPEAVTLRSRSARNESCTSLTTTVAPTPTLPPWSAASASACETTVNDPLDPIVTAPVASSVWVSEPMRAVVWSLAITIAMPAPTATEPAAPFFAVVVIVWGELAVTVTAPAPVRPAPSCDL